MSFEESVVSLARRSSAEATFEAGVSFERARFLADMTFGGAIPDMAKFRHAIFLGWAQFEQVCSFQGCASMGRGSLKGPSSFRPFQRLIGIRWRHLRRSGELPSIVVAGGLSFTGVRPTLMSTSARADFSRGYVAFGQSVFRGTG